LIRRPVATCHNHLRGQLEVIIVPHHRWREGDYCGWRHVNPSSSYATWSYLVEPYVFTWPGVEAHEVESWTENGETWRVLSVTFPDSIDTHNKTRLYYFDDAGLLRRMDYQPVVDGQMPVAHDIRSEGTVDGIVVPTKRHIYARNEDRTPDLSAIRITIDLSDIRFS
jgi:hypothetical protein